MPKAMNWNAELYDHNHHFVADYGQDLIGLLNPVPGEAILDAGCGTGTLTHQLKGFGAEMTGIDSSPEMIERAQLAFPEMDFRVADLTGFELEKQFDGIFSNATLHWVKPPEKAVQSLYRHLKPGGRLVLEMGGKGNVQSIITALHQSMKAAGAPTPVGDSGWYFPSPGTYVQLLESAGFEVELAYYFKRPTKLVGLDGMKNWIEMFGGNSFQDIDGQVIEKVIQGAVDRLKPTNFLDNQWWADYIRLRIKANKPS